MNRTAILLTGMIVIPLLLSACSVLPGVGLSPVEATPQVFPTLDLPSAVSPTAAPAPSQPTQPLPTQPVPSLTQPPPTQPAMTQVPVVQPQPVSTQAPVVQPTTPPLTNLNDFSQKLAAVLEMRDFDLLRVYMRDRFAFATWNSSLNVVDSNQAIQTLSQDRLAPGSQPVVRFGTDVVQLLNGTDPLALWGPVDQVVRAYHVMGLGPQATGEGVIVIGRDPNTGSLYFHGLLTPPGDYFTLQSNDMVTSTPVQAVVALDYLNVRTGPGFNFAVEGALREGEIATVTGISLDNVWWQIRCVQDASGFCWVSADPSLTQPTNRP